MREFPLESIHPLAFKAAEGALCAADQGKYWEMHARLFANQRALAPDDLVAHAQALGLDKAAFARCLESGQKAATVRQDLSDGEKAGITGTPTFFLGLTDGAGGPVKIVNTIKGAQPFASFKTAIDGMLTNAGR